MANPLQNRGEEQRRGDGEKIIAIVDLIAIIARALVGIFGRREADKRRSI